MEKNNANQLHITYKEKVNYWSSWNWILSCPGDNGNEANNEDNSS